ncbi:clathrin associated protein complex large subunit [Serendipita sp. 400]|nr:clathrin associated protein complex large subunit [Serendipita sp. 400]
MPYHNLKALIKAIRACKTFADERSLIISESAAIRASFRAEDSFTRHNNIAKLLYIQMLGYPAQWGQIECLKLVASPRFADKRLGYLGIMLLLDESQEVLTLVTNSLKNDMNHSNMYVVGLALCTFANIASEEMARDLCNEIEKLLGSSNTYIRKKAALCALRVVRKVPDLHDHFIEKTKSLLNDRNHGVLLSGITLAVEMCQHAEECLGEFKSLLSLLVRHLKSLVTTGYSPEHDVAGITDPFLQVKIIRMLRLLGRNDAQASETMNDILAQVATNTDSSKNVGNSILYEAVLAILDIEADSGLRVMAINILGKFLSNKDNNIRYVALHTLNKVVSMDTNAVQRHRNIVLDCLRDGDISIRRRALELSYALINESNVQVMIRELLAFLEVADNEFKLGMTTQICLAAERLAPNKRWHIDTVLRVLKLAGDYVREEILSAFIRLVCHTPELQSYTVSKLLLALKADVSQESLTLGAVWLIGEFSTVLMEQGVHEGDQVRPVTDVEILDLLETVLHTPYANAVSRQFVLVAITKISTRTRTTEPTRQRIADILQKYETSPDLETQQRAIEFAALFAQTGIRSGVLEEMPPPEVKSTVVGVVSENKPVGPTAPAKDSTLVDLMGDEPAVVSSGGAAVGASQANEDLLSQIFGGGTSTSTTTAAGNGATAPPAAAAGKGKQAINDILGLFDSPSSISTSAPAATALSGGASSLLVAASQPATRPAPAAAAGGGDPPKTAGYVAYDKNSLKITLHPQVSAQKPGIILVSARFEASGGQPVQGVNFQAAVPKTQQLQMAPMSNADVHPGKTETQALRIVAPPGSSIRLRLRVSFTMGGQSIVDQVDFNGFPPGLSGTAQ